MESRRNIDVVRDMLGAFLAGADDRALRLLHPDVQFDTTVRPDGRVWRGRAAVRLAMGEWIEAWEDYELSVERYLQAGADRVVMLWRERGRARGSGVPQAQSGATVFTVRGGQIVEMVPTLDRAATLAALGVGVDMSTPDGVRGDD
jgi:ketosteroid isomerase-like protein